VAAFGYQWTVALSLSLSRSLSLPGCVARVSDSASSQGVKRIRRDRTVQGGIKRGMVFTLPVPECDVADSQSHTCLHRDVKVFTVVSPGGGGGTLGVSGALDRRRHTRVPGPMHRLATVQQLGPGWSGVESACTEQLDQIVTRLRCRNNSPAKSPVRMDTYW